MDPVTICNAALSSLGAARITSLSDETTEANLCSSFYPMVKPKFLASYPWNPAVKRDTLRLLGDSPLNQWTHAYALPKDSVRVLRVYRPARAGTAYHQLNEVDYQVEGNRILTNFAGAIAKYLADIPESDMTPAMQQALSYTLASDIAYAVTGSTQVQTQMFNLAESSLMAAKTNDAMEGSTEVYHASHLLEVRF